MVNRRDFGKLSAGAAVTPFLGGLNALAAAPGVPNTFSVMLWTIDNKIPYEKRLEMVAEAGYTSVEVGNEYEKWTPEEWKKYTAKLKQLKLGVDSAVPGRNSLADVSQRGKLTEDLKKAIPGAKDLGCKQFIYTAFKRVPGQTPEQQRAAIVDTLKYAADVLEKDQFEIVLEPIDLLEHKEEAVVSVSEAFAICREVKSPRITVLYDFYHEQRQAGNLIEKLDGNIDLVGLVHVADVPGRHEPGTGEMFWPNIYKKLAELKYKRVICMEYKPVGDWVKTLTASRLEAEKYLKQM